ncbi:MAG: hypothetical protein ACYSWQ_27475 [Planctomycetota bacterium]
MMDKGDRSLLSVARPNMFTRELQLLCLLLLLPISLTGCAVSVDDRLPAGVPKGYVEFRFVDESSEVWISKIVEGLGTDNERGIGSRFSVWNWETARRVAERPGKYTYRLTKMIRRSTTGKYGEAARKYVEVEVFEGMITPVRVKYGERVTRSEKIGPSTYHWGRRWITAEVQEPVPFEE